MLDSSIDCSPFRLEWQPSRWRAVGALMLWPLATFSLLCTRWAEGVPTGLAIGLLVVAVGIGAWRALALVSEPRALLELWPDGRARWVSARAATVEGAAIAHEQWPVTTVRFVACGTTIVFWPDTLCASGRRLLRRWARSATPASPLPQFWMG